VGLSTTTFALDVQGLPEVISTGAGNAYLHLPGVIVAENAAGERRFLLPDGLGSVRQVVDEAAAVAVYHEFDPYGNPVADGGEPYGYTGEWWEEEVGLLYLRARWYTPETGSFLSKDPVESEPPYLYARGNPINLTDPTGLCAKINDEACWRIYHEIVKICPICAGRTRRDESSGRIIRLHEEDVLYLQAVLDEVQSGFIIPIPNYPDRLADPLSEQQWNLVKQEAGRFGIPKELLAATIAAEIVYDTDWINTVYNINTAIVGNLSDFAYVTRDRPLFNLCNSVLEGFHEYFGLAPYLEPRGIGYGFAPGIANIHAGPAIRVENYINETYPGQNLLPDLGFQNQKAVRLRTLLSDEGSIRYAAAYLRQWADVRTGSTSGHTTDLTDNDMIIIYTVYRCSVDACYGSVEEFQKAQTPSPYGGPDDFAVFLPIYKKRP
nr:hypothetical protein [Gammaproteobacteria bacterium]NIW99740.1 hypothetical protein [Phycisphaerae bacterium]